MELKFYRTYSWGGVEGRDIEKRDFVTESLARKDALLDTWNNGFSLHEVTLTIDKRVTEKDKVLEKELECGYDIIMRRRENGEKVSIDINPARRKFYEETKFPKSIISYYRTYSYGIEGPQIETRDFKTEEDARQNALDDKYNSGFTLARVDLILEGRITKKVTELGEIKKEGASLIENKGITK
ncbi:MAG: hypothetical protein IJN90_03910 [Bacilli bacterium]|nr:hypothetical protein [Bacilli bacterium]